MPTGAPGRVDLLITHPHHVTVLEWKSIKIDFFEIKAPVGRRTGHSKLGKALALSKISDMSEPPDPKSGKSEGRTIKN